MGVHVCAPEFRPVVGQYEFYKRYCDYFKKVKLPKDYDGFTAEIIMREAYYDIYGIADLDSDRFKRPLVAFTNADTFGDTGPIAEIIAEFRDNDIGNLFGMSFLDYCELPYSISRLLLNRTKIERDTEKEIKEQVEHQLAAESRRNRQ